MSDAYQKTIQFLQIYQGIPQAQNLLAKATDKLLEEEEEFKNQAEIEMNIPIILNSIRNSDRSKLMVMRIITEALFSRIKIKNQTFDYVNPGVYWFARG